MITGLALVQDHGNLLGKLLAISKIVDFHAQPRALYPEITITATGLVVQTCECRVRRECGDEGGYSHEKWKAIVSC